MSEKSPVTMIAAKKTATKKSPAKKVTKKKAAKKKTAKKKTTAANRKPYPSVPLQNALKVAAAIKEYNGGNTWASEDVAKAVGLGGKSNEFYYLTAASRDFGLTEGTRNTATISLTDLGRSIVYASTPEDELKAKSDAFLGIEIFKKVLDHYQGSDLPEMKYLGNTLEREFKLAPDYHEEFSRLFRENTKYLGITSGTSSASTEPEGVESSSSGTEQKTTVTMGEPKVKTKLKAFVIMPFSEKGGNRPEGFFAEVLRTLITPAGVDSGFKVETANRQGSDLIQSTIINELLSADLVVADLTDHNPNVLFELGIRMAKDKPVALIKATGTGRIFDVDNMLRVYEYNANLWRTTVERDLPELVSHIKGAWDTRESERSYMKILRDAAGEGK